ncbi:MAG: cell division protein ZapE [Hyphomonadaceae bacterium]
MGKVADEYARLLADGSMLSDPAQAEALSRLDELSVALTSSKSGFFSKATPPRGLYIWGGVGRGKSMLMDLFFAQTEIEQKTRIHFHAFMQDVHAFLNYWRGLSEKERKRSQWRVRGQDIDDPIWPAAAKIAAKAKLLCFDEFQVSQITDAMILSRLFDALFAQGITMVSTSNRPPDDLYKDGLNRQYFTPFIDRLKQSCDTLNLASERDYRLDRLSEAPVWYTPLGADADAALDAAWSRLTLGAKPETTSLTVAGRQLPVPAHAGGLARFSFADLCAQPLGPADYLMIAARFHTVLIDNIPALSPDNRNEAIRFVTLIDALYEAKTNLVASADADPDALYPTGTGSFEFQRTASRLYEMRSTEYFAMERVVASE